MSAEQPPKEHKIPQIVQIHTANNTHCFAHKINSTNCLAKTIQIFHHNPINCSGQASRQQSRASSSKAEHASCSSSWCAAPRAAAAARPRCAGWRHTTGPLGRSCGADAAAGPIWRGRCAPIKHGCSNKQAQNRPLRTDRRRGRDCRPPWLPLLDRTSSDLQVASREVTVGPHDRRRRRPHGGRRICRYPFPSLA
jgi:hypothetical protein